MTARAAQRHIRDSDITGKTPWRLCVPAGELAWRQWQGELVVYNPMSGATHVLDIASGEVLRALMAGPAGRDDLAQRLASFLAVEPDAQARTAVDRILADLDSLGLVEPAVP